MQLSPSLARWTFPGLCALLALSISCAPKKTLKTGAESGADVAESTSTANGEPSIESGEADIRGGAFQSVPELEPVHFAYDNYNLDEDARIQLRKNAEYLKTHAGMQVLVTGFCDERGTESYNLALGQRRAKSAREYYIHLGVRAKSIATLSYGKEKPVCAEHTDDCWAQNRRAETTIRSAKATRAPASTDATSQ